MDVLCTTAVSYISAMVICTRYVLRSTLFSLGSCEVAHCCLSAIPGIISNNPPLYLENMVDFLWPHRRGGGRTSYCLPGTRWYFILRSILLIYVYTEKNSEISRCWSFRAKLYVYRVLYRRHKSRYFRDTWYARVKYRLDVQ